MTVTSPLIDCHAHVWGSEMPFISTAWTRPTYAYTVEDWLADLDAHHIRYGVIAAASLFGTYNDYTIRALRQHARLRGTAIVDPSIDLYALEAMRGDGIVGIRLQWFMLDPLPDLGNDDYRSALEAPCAISTCISISTSKASGLQRWPHRSSDAGVKLVIDHFGWHDPAPRLAAQSYQDMLRLLDGGHAWVKITAGFRHPSQKLPNWEIQAEYTADLLARFGPEKLLWGSDAPFVGHENAATYATALDMWAHCVPDAARQAIGENGYRFYFAS